MSDRVELTGPEKREFERQYRHSLRGRIELEGLTFPPTPQLFRCVESIVAARVAALIAERDDWHESATHRLSEGMRFRAERDAARAELSAANTRCAELETGIAKLRDGMHEFMRGNWPESPTPVEVYSALAALTPEGTE